VSAAFGSTNVTSNACGFLLREVDAHFGFLDRFAACFTDQRDLDLVGHPLVDGLRQRVFGRSLGNEDLYDYDQFRLDIVLAVLVGEPDPLRQQRVRTADRGKLLAGKSTQNRLALTLGWPGSAEPGLDYWAAVGFCGA
jgi:hypothetical protein